MNGLPDAEVERDLHAGLLLVVGLRNLDLDGDPLGVRLDFAETRDAVGTPKEPDEFIGETRITKSDEHLSPTFFDERNRFKSGPSGPTTRLG